MSHSDYGIQFARTKRKKMKKIIQYIHIKPESSFESIDKQLKHLRIEGER